MIEPANNPPPLDPSLMAYQMDFQRSDWGQLLAPFSPPLPGTGQVILASLFGDVFIELGGGEVWWINSQMQRIESVADSREAFAERLGAEHDVFLRTALVDALIRKDMLLKFDMIYGLRQPAAEGGRWHPDNVGAASVAEAFAYWGDLFRRAMANASATVPTLAKAGAQADKTKKKGWFN